MSRFRAAIFDWAGTTIDFGSFAPVDAFVRAFAAFGITATIAQAREPMGAAKRDHIRAMMAMPDLARQWAATQGHEPRKADIDTVYDRFVPMTREAAAAHATLVPGCKDAVDALRGMGLRIGSTTGYTRSIMERILPLAAAQGYAPDTLVCADDLPEGRPGPLCIYKCMVDLVAYPPAAILKVDDTAPGILEGVAAGCVTVGVTLSGNAVGKRPQELAAMSADEIADLRETATRRLRAAGADHVIDTVAELPSLVRRLDAAG